MRFSLVNFQMYVTNVNNKILNMYIIKSCKAYYVVETNFHACKLLCVLLVSIYYLIYDKWEFYEIACSIPVL